MFLMDRPLLMWCAVLCLSSSLCGCAEKAKSTDSGETEQSQEESNISQTDPNSQQTKNSNRQSKPQPVQLENHSPTTSPPQPVQLTKTPSRDPNISLKPAPDEVHSPGSEELDGPMEEIKLALSPLQVLLGNWRGVSQKIPGEQPGSKAVILSDWVWDFKSNREQPALVMTSESGVYLKEARLTWLPEKEVFHMSLTDEEGTIHVFEGDYSEKPSLIPGENNNKPQRTFKLKLTQISPEPGARELVFNQQENNRYQLLVYEKRGTRMTLRDTVGTQREGTSFAQTEENYGERECIVSQGLGTMTVSHEGKTYYVCCTGCRDAFNDDPDFWITKLEDRLKAQEME